MKSNKMAKYKKKTDELTNIGVYAKLTNSYCLIAPQDTVKCTAEVREKLSNFIPVIETTIGGCQTIGSLTVGNKHGLLVPQMTTDEEMQHIVSNLPKDINVRRINSNLSALGNVISCNDDMALISPYLDVETEEIISDVLKVLVYRRVVCGNSLVGSCVLFTNRGGMVPTVMSDCALQNLSSVLGLPLVRGSVNEGCEPIAIGLIANDWTAFSGPTTNIDEINAIGEAFQLLL